jgi:membrane-associated phospholipid phosphatase
MGNILCGILLAGLLGTSSLAHADEDPSDVSLLRLNPFSDILENTAHAFTGWNLALQLAGVASAPIIITSGADTDVHNYVVEHHRLGVVSTPAVYGGYVAPFVIGGSLLAWGVAKHSRRALAASSAVLQAGLLMLVYQSVLKSVTGRPHPEPVRYDDDSASRTFRFGFMRGGLHYGWPSGHLMISTSIFASLVRVYPDNLWLKLGGSALLGYVLYAVATHESNSMHWLSDMVSGTLMGLAIGNAVGVGFAKRASPGSSERHAFAVAPMLSGQARGLSLWMRF